MTDKRELWLRRICIYLFDCHLHKNSFIFKFVVDMHDKHNNKQRLEDARNKNGDREGQKSSPLIDFMQTISFISIAFAKGDCFHDFIPIRIVGFDFYAFFCCCLFLGAYVLYRQEINNKVLISISKEVRMFERSQHNMNWQQQQYHNRHAMHI